MRKSILFLLLAASMIISGCGSVKSATTMSDTDTSFETNVVSDDLNLNDFRPIGTVYQVGREHKEDVRAQYYQNDDLVVLKISGTGDTQSFTENSLPPWSESYEYKKMEYVVMDEAVVPTDMSFWFRNSGLTRFPKIPTSCKRLSHTFENCYKLQGEARLPEGMEDISYAFSCSGLEKIVEIPKSVKDMSHAFTFTFLEEAPAFPPNVENISGAYMDITSLRKGADIPQSVQSMAEVFAGCKALSGTIRVDAFPEKTDGFDGAYAFDGITEGQITVEGNSAYLDEIKSNMETKW